MCLLMRTASSCTQLGPKLPVQLSQHSHPLWTQLYQSLPCALKPLHLAPPEHASINEKPGCPSGMACLNPGYFPNFPSWWWSHPTLVIRNLIIWIISCHTLYIALLPWELIIPGDQEIILYIWNSLLSLNSVLHIGALLRYKIMKEKSTKQVHCFHEKCHLVFVWFWVCMGLVHSGLRKVLLTSAAVCGGAWGHYEISRNGTLKSVQVYGIPQSPPHTPNGMA